MLQRCLLFLPIYFSLAHTLFDNYNPSSYYVCEGVNRIYITVLNFVLYSRGRALYTCTAWGACTVACTIWGLALSGASPGSKICVQINVARRSVSDASPIPRPPTTLHHTRRPRPHHLQRQKMHPRFRPRASFPVSGSTSSPRTGYARRLTPSPCIPPLHPAFRISIVHRSRNDTSLAGGDIGKITRLCSQNITRRITVAIPVSSSRKSSIRAACRPPSWPPHGATVT